MEQKEIDLLRGKGFEIKTVLFGKVKKWKTKKMCLGRLIELSNIFFKMKVLESSKEFEDVIADQYNSIKQNAKNSAKAMAVCVTDNLILRKILTYHFLKNISSLELMDFSQNLIKQADYQNFMLSIVLMNANRVTKPQTIEKKGV